MKGRWGTLALKSRLPTFACNPRCKRHSFFGSCLHKRRQGAVCSCTFALPLNIGLGNAFLLTNRYLQFTGLNEDGFSEGVRICYAPSLSFFKCSR